MQFCLRFLSASAVAGMTRGAPSQASTSPSPVSGAEVRDSAESKVAAMHSLYRRLLKAGEEGSMLQRCLTVNTLSESVTHGLALLRLHRELTTVDAAARQTKWWRLCTRTRQGVARRYYAWRLLWLRLHLRSRNAIADVLVYVLFLTVCVLLYEIYRVCRIGVDRAQERYRTLAIPIISTFDALEEAQRYKRALRREMEEDIMRNR